MTDSKILLLPFSSLKRVGSALEEYLTNLTGQNRLFNLLLHKPMRIEPILLCPRLFEVANDQLVILKLRVESHIKPATNRQPYKVICYTPTGYVNLIFFKIFPNQISKMPVGTEIAVLGRLQRLNDENQIIHPQEILPAEEIGKMPKLNVVYPLSAGISQKFLSQKITDILGKIEEKNNEWIDQNFLKQQNWPNFREALKNLHYLSSETILNSELNLALQLHEQARKRLAYDELLAWQIAVLLAKSAQKKNKNFSKAKENLAQKFLAALPFRPTAAQLKAIKEIESEIFSAKKMLRLLQGDVGSGKTIVAIAACLHNISQQKQSCVIAPTTVLAKQHFSYFQRLLGKFNLRIELLTSATTKKQKEKILDELKSGKIDILLGTHAILENDVRFRKLGLAVIDEQHRFGVMQRLKLVEKGDDVDLLLMSATPIPRSLMMALYGDMDISILNEKPKNRQEIETLLISSQKIDEVHEAMKRAVSRGEKIYWICPAIDESEEMELAAAKKKFDELVKIFSKEKVALLHGKMKEKEKEKVMSEFAAPVGSLKILVSTTVIEVGIDVPDATIILIENAESFGLSQLHQLRGRVGRSDKKSFCILLYGENVPKRTFLASQPQISNWWKRLNVLRQSNNGFFIAEEDLKMRGSGELLGTKQSGFPEFKIANLNSDSDLLKTAHKNAALVLHRDENLQKSESEKFRELLKLFNYDECLRMVAGG